MPFIKTEQLPGEPIYVIQFDGALTADDVKTSYMETSRFWSDDLRSTGFHVVIRLEQVESNFLVTMNALRASAEMETLLHEVAPYLRQYVVGSDAMTRLYSEARQLPQFGGRQVPVFRTFEDALEAARLSIRNHLAGAVESSPSETLS